MLTIRIESFRKKKYKFIQNVRFIIKHLKEIFKF